MFSLIQSHGNRQQGWICGRNLWSEVENFYEKKTINLVEMTRKAIFHKKMWSLKWKANCESVTASFILCYQLDWSPRHGSDQPAGKLISKSINSVATWLDTLFVNYKLINSNWVIWNDFFQPAVIKTTPWIQSWSCWAGGRETS